MMVHSLQDADPHRGVSHVRVLLRGVDSDFGKFGSQQRVAFTALLRDGLAAALGISGSRIFLAEVQQDASGVLVASCLLIDGPRAEAGVEPFAPAAVAKLKLSLLEGAVAKVAGAWLGPGDIEEATPPGPPITPPPPPINNVVGLQLCLPRIQSEPDEVD